MTVTSVLSAGRKQLNKLTEHPLIRHRTGMRMYLWSKSTLFWVDFSRAALAVSCGVLVQIRWDGLAGAADAGPACGPQPGPVWASPSPGPSLFKGTITMTRFVKFYSDLINEYWKLLTQKCADSIWAWSSLFNIHSVSLSVPDSDMKMKY